MTEEEIRREREEAERLAQRINHLVDQINRSIRENQMLEQELAVIINQVHQLTRFAEEMGYTVDEEMGRLSGHVGDLDGNTSAVFEALQELSASYFIFKNIGTASKNISMYTDEYYTKFSYYNELRRITLGYVIGLDAHICSSGVMREKVEKAYLQNTEYWLAYCIAATMLWASGEKEAAERAVGKSLSINYFNACLYYLLINLRFTRIEAAKKWYVNYLDRADMNNLGEEWQYLLQAYLSGAFGADRTFRDQVARCFLDMLDKIEVTNADYGKKVAKKAQDFAEAYLHKTEHEYFTLKKTCPQYEEMKTLLSYAERNAVIARYYNRIAETEADTAGELPQRIEDVLYALISNYDEEELKVIKKLRYNEAIVRAKGDLSAAQANYNAMFGDGNARRSLDDLLINWAFSDDNSQTHLSVRRFSVSFLKDWIVKGFEQFAAQYRQKEQDKYAIVIEECRMECNEDDFEASRDVLEKFLDRNKLKDTLKDKFVLIYLAVCAAALLTLGVMAFVFSKIALVIAVLLALGGSFLLWRRILDMGRILKEKKRSSVDRLKQALDELKRWRTLYKEEDARNTDLKDALESF